MVRFLTRHRIREESNWVGIREVMTLAFPIILSTLSVMLIQTVDTLMVGRLGAASVGALTSANIWAFTLATFILGVAGSVTTFVSQSIGRGREQDCGRYAWQAIHMAVPAAALALVLWPLTGPFFRAMGMPADVTRLAIDYFEIRLIGYAFMAWLTALTMFFQAIGRPMIPTVTSFIAVGVNIVLNALLIFGLFGFPRLEVQGAAIATVIALGLQCVLLQGIFLSRAVDSRYATRGAWRFDRVKWGELLRIGVPAGLTFFMDVATWGIFTSFIVGRFGEMQLAAHSVALAVMHLSFMPAVGLNHAIAPIVGKYIGAKDIPRAMARTHTCYKLAISYMTCMGIVAAIGGPVIIRWFLPHASPELVRTGHTLLMMAALFQAFDAINIVASGALRGAGDTRWMAIITFFMAYGCFLPVAGGLAILVGWEAPGAWVGATIYIIALSGFLFTRFESRRWQSIRVFADDDPEAAADPVIDAEPAPSPGPATPAG